MPGRQELPSTLRRSPAKAQRTWIEAHDSAVQQYGEGERGRSTMSRGELLSTIRKANRSKTREKQPSSR